MQQSTTQKYTKNSIQNHVQYESFTNPSQNINIRNTESRLGKQLQDRIQGSMQSNVKGQVTKVQYHEVEELKTKPEIKLLRGNIHINSTCSGLSNGQIQDKSIKLAPKLNLGSQEGSMLRPQTDRTTDYTNVNLKRKK